MVVSSSSPSSPRKTRARAPRSANTPAITSHMPRSKTPMAEETGRAGLVSGPRKLKTVGTASSRRVLAAYFSDGWNSGAKQKVIPTSSATAAVSSGSRSITTPSRSSTSAVPHEEEAARLPCLTTRAPAAEATMEAIVETLTVCARSPPVPTMSRVCPGTEISTALSSMPWARPRTSATVSPLARSATAKPAIWASVADPDMISFIAHSVSEAERDAPSSSAPISWDQVRSLTGIPCFLSFHRERGWTRRGRAGAPSGGVRPVT